MMIPNPCLNHISFRSEELGEPVKFTKIQGIKLQEISLQMSNPGLACNIRMKSAMNLASVVGKSIEEISND
jgi:hypothetical protein